jgi:glucosamine--fructose-6-phosphate aminotransferase (isomerizing)
MTRAGREIGVASTKAFTTQLLALLLLTLAIAQHRNTDSKTISQLIQQLRRIPNQIEQALKLDKVIKALATNFVAKQSVLFLGRGDQYPIAMEGALKLKELSYIHAEAYPAGELKHGPLALVDSHMPIVAIAPNDELAHKLQSNLDEVKARDGQIYIFADPALKISEDANTHVITMPSTDNVTSPIVYTIPLQLLAYHVAVLKGTDVDQPRNLAKSVTVE